MRPLHLPLLSRNPGYALVVCGLLVKLCQTWYVFIKGLMQLRTLAILLFEAKCYNFIQENVQQMPIILCWLLQVEVKHYMHGLTQIHLCTRGVVFKVKMADNVLYKLCTLLIIITFLCRQWCTYFKADMPFTTMKLLIVIRGIFIQSYLKKETDQYWTQSCINDYYNSTIIILIRIC